MLKERVLSAIVILIPVSVLFWIGGVPLQILGVVLFGMVNFELLAVALSIPLRWILAVESVLFLLPAGFLLNGWSGFGIAIVIVILLMGIISILLLEGTKHALPFERVFPALSLSVAYTGVLGTMPLVIISCPLGKTFLIWELIIIIVSDTAAYFGGMAFGKRPLASRISPKKTIAGAVSGFSVAVIAGLLSWNALALPLPAPKAVVLVILMAILAQVGDLVESSVKRLYGVKDMSGLIPGHGGVLDRVDSFLFAAPVLLLACIWSAA